MENLDTLLLDSIKRYENILALFATFSTETESNNPATLHTRGTTLLQLQEEAALADADLAIALQEMSSTLSSNQLAAHPLLNKRKDIMQQVLDNNRSLLTTINSIKSLLAHEIKELQSGRTALTGYRQTTSSSNGGILNDSL